MMTQHKNRGDYKSEIEIREMRLHDDDHTFYDRDASRMKAKRKLSENRRPDPTIYDIAEHMIDLANRLDPHEDTVTVEAIEKLRKHAHMIKKEGDKAMGAPSDELIEWVTDLLVAEIQAESLLDIAKELQSKVKSLQGQRNRLQTKLKSIPFPVE